MAEGERIVRISHEIYPQECLDSAIKEYAEYCTIKKPSRTSTETLIAFCALPEHRAKDDYLFNEFLNYLLDLSMESALTNL